MCLSTAKVLLLMLSMICVALCTDDNCVWTYKCCSFTEVNGQVSCERMCEPEINCATMRNEVTMIEDDDDGPLEMKATICRKGFQFYRGRCRRVFGTKE